MDPNATFRELIKAMEDGDSESAVQHAFNLKAWLDEKGFSPCGKVVPTEVGAFQGVYFGPIFVRYLCEAVLSHEHFFENDES